MFIYPTTPSSDIWCYVTSLTLRHFSSTRKMVVDERNFGDSTIEDVSTEPNPVLLVESDSHLIANILSSILEIPIVIIESTLEKYVRLFLPTVIQVPGNTIIYLAHNTKDDVYYNTEEKGIVKAIVNTSASFINFLRYLSFFSP